MPNSAINVTVPKLSHTSSDTSTSTEKTETIEGIATSVDSQKQVLNVFQGANSLLWYILVVLVFFTIVGAGAYLITSDGNEDRLKKANRMLIYTVIAIFLALLSGTIILTFTNFFST